MCALAQRPASFVPGICGHGRYCLELRVACAWYPWSWAVLFRVARRSSLSSAVIGARAQRGASLVPSICGAPCTHCKHCELCTRNVLTHIAQIVQSVARVLLVLLLLRSCMRGMSEHILYTLCIDNCWNLYIYTNIYTNSNSTCAHA